MATAQDVAAAIKALEDARAAKEKTQDRIASLESRLSYSIQTGINPREVELIRQQIELAKFNLVRETTEVQNAQLELNQVSTAAVTPDPDLVSSGAVVANNQTARTDGATAQNPTSLVTEPLGSVEEPIEVDSPPPAVKTIAQTQATPAPDINAGRIQNAATLVNGGITARDALNINVDGGKTTNTNNTSTAARKPGVGDGRADKPIVTGNSTKDIINATFGTATNQRIITQPNVLDEYASYTYQISWYLLSTDQYNQLMAGPRPRVAQWTLLMQSGGAPKTTSNNSTGASSPGGRSAMFPVDYYIDDLEITTALPGGGTQAAHLATEIKFKVTEPNGLTLIQNLYRANKAMNTPPGAFVNDGTVPDYGSQDQRAAKDPANLPPNYLRAQYCLIIRFYGYDSQGNLSAPLIGRYNRTGTGQVTATDPRAVIEKIYPIFINEITFRTAKSQIEYQITAAPVGQQMAIGQSRGTIPFNFQLAGATVKDVLTGNAPQTLSTLPGERAPQAEPSDSQIPAGPPDPVESAYSGAGRLGGG